MSRYYKMGDFLTLLPLFINRISSLNNFPVSRNLMFIVYYYVVDRVWLKQNTMAIENKRLQLVSTKLYFIPVALSSEKYTRQLLQMKDNGAICNAFRFAVRNYRENIKLQELPYALLHAKHRQ